MRPSLSCLAALCLLAQPGSAIFRDEVGVIDFHAALVGQPRPDATFFHQPQQSSKASLLYTLSERNVLGAVNPKDGSLVWRQRLGDGTNLTASLRPGPTADTVVSGLGSEVVVWGASDGRQVWTFDLGEQRVRDLEVIETEAGSEVTDSKDILVLAEGGATRVLLLDGKTGQTKWQHVDDSSDLAHQVSASTTQAFYVSLHSALIGSGLKIRVTSLDLQTGKKNEQYSLSSEGDIGDASHVLAVGANSAFPIVAWTDKSYSSLKVNVFGSRSIASFNVAASTSEPITKVSIHGPSNSVSRPHFLVSFNTATQSWAEVYHVDPKKSTVSKAYNLPKLSEASTFAATSDGSNVFFTRVSPSELSVVSSASHGILTRWNLVGSKGEWSPVHAITELSVKGDSVSAARSAVLLSNGDWLLIRDATVAWTRPEALADTIVAAFAYPPSALDGRDSAAAATTVLDSPLRAYIQRWQRHINQLIHLPAYLQDLPALILTNLGLQERSESSLLKDLQSFGFHKVIVCITRTGRAVGLDAGARGKVLWNTAIPAQYRSYGSQIPALKALPDGIMHLQADSFSGSIYTFEGATGNPTEHQAIEDAGKHLNIKTASDGIVAVGQDSHNTGWHFRATPHERVIAVAARAEDEPVASIGRVLGDRRVLYKYLNPNLLLVATAASSKIATVTVSVLDALSGDILHTKSHSNVVLTLPFAAAVSENWFAYTFTEIDETEVRATQLVIGELYESSIPDDRGPSVNGTSRFPLSRPYIPLQTYIVPEPISQLSVSQTKQGITSRELIAVLPFSESIVGIPRAALDPRRPVDREPSKMEQAEGLVRYGPALEFDPRWYLNHERDLLGVRNVTTSPAVLESTSLVFGYGLDVFGTRISPSFTFDLLGKDFNKIQMLGTVAALAVLTFGVQPLVSRKLVNAGWSFAS